MILPSRFWIILCELCWTELDQQPGAQHSFVRLRGRSSYGDKQEDFARGFLKWIIQQNHEVKQQHDVTIKNVGQVKQRFQRVWSIITLCRFYLLLASRYLLIDFNFSLSKCVELSARELPYGFVQKQGTCNSNGFSSFSIFRWPYTGVYTISRHACIEIPSLPSFSDPLLADSLPTGKAYHMDPVFNKFVSSLQRSSQSHTHLNIHCFMSRSFHHL